MSEPTPSASWADASVDELRAAFASGATTPSRTAHAVLERIARDTPLNAYHAVTAEEALRAAEGSDVRHAGGRPLGPLDGVPVTVKENLGRVGVTMPSGTALPDSPTPAEDSTVVSRLREAGAVIVGSTVMPDWGMLSSGVSSRHGITRSAWDPSLTTGGSSSGAAVAAAAAHGPVHVGTDIGGSIRLPGTWNALATLKPSAGLIPLNSPYVGRAAGPMARRVADLFPLMRAAARWDDRDVSAHPFPPADFSPGETSPEGMRVGLQLDGGPGLPLAPAVRAACLDAAERFAAAGADIVEVDPITTEQLLVRVDRFWRVRALNTLRKLPAHLRDGYVLEYILAWCLGGRDVDGVTTLDDYEALAELGAKARGATRGLDLVLSPVTPQTAFPAEQPMPHPEPGEPMAHISYTLPYNMSGQPAGTANAGRDADGKWIGLQFAGPVGTDARLLRLMAWWERQRPEPAVPDWRGCAWSSTGPR
ncbi:amidase [Nocardiopsis nanhaiensis]